MTNKEAWITLVCIVCIVFMLVFSFDININYAHCHLGH